MSEVQSTKPKGGVIHSLQQAWLIILLALLYGVALAGVQIKLKPLIDANKAKKTLKAVPILFGEYTDPKQTKPTVTKLNEEHPDANKIVSEAGTFITTQVIVKDPNGSDVKITRVTTEDHEHIGWLIPASGAGYGDVIELLIGVDADVETIKGIYILAQKETPGLGNKIVTDDFRANYKDAPASRQLVVVKREKKDGNEIKAIKGATVSSDCTTAIVNTAINAFKEKLQALNGNE